MNQTLKSILRYLLVKKKFGGAHVPEKNVVYYMAKWSDKREKKDFEKEYKEYINNEIILRQKKRTGKGTDWHISLNPKKLKEIYESLEQI